ncbi:MAG: histidine--tRNA ligase, partial [Erysipelotrichaceae bacterium]|nr:histidine--tRNA ligase [Erysipelotrichaceae bacterium]
QKRSLKAQFKASDRLKAKVIIILGEDEAASQTAVIKNTATREQFTVKENELVATVEKIMKGDN